MQQAPASHQGTQLGISSGRTSKNGAVSQQVGNSKQRAQGTALCSRGRGHGEASALLHLQGTHNPGNCELVPVTWLLYNSRAGEASNAQVRSLGITTEKGDPWELACCGLSTLVYLLCSVYREPEIHCSSDQLSFLGLNGTFQYRNTVQPLFCAHVKTLPVTRQLVNKTEASGERGFTM